jgi:CDP-2,3-bis-(O-geranylgeranyl)-sn-glycerol synthase
MADLLQLVALAIWTIFPAYVANAAPVVLGGGRPIDGGRKFSDGRPILGPGKTIRGFAAGIIAGTVFAVLQGAAVGSLYPYISRGLLLSLGALTGDLLGSFLKRRINLERGAPAPVMDQIGFVVVALIFASPVLPLGWEVTLIILIITLPIHLATNIAGHRLKLKDRPY